MSYTSRKFKQYQGNGAFSSYCRKIIPKTGSESEYLSFTFNSSKQASQSYPVNPYDDDSGKTFCFSGTLDGETVDRVYCLKISKENQSDDISISKILLNIAGSSDNTDSSSIYEQKLINDEISYTFPAVVIFKPNTLNVYNQIEITASSNSMTSGTLKLNIEIYELFNLLDPDVNYESDCSNIQLLCPDEKDAITVYKIGVWGKPGQIFYLNNEQFRLGRTGFYELYNKNITVTFLGIIPDDNPIIIDFLYDTNSEEE